MVQNNADAMIGATADASGAQGFVPVPAAGDQDKVLSGAGTWVENQDTRVTQQATGQSTEGEFPILTKRAAGADTATDAARFSAAVTVNHAAGMISANRYNAFVMSSSAPTEQTDVSGLAEDGLYTHYYD